MDAFQNHSKESRLLTGGANIRRATWLQAEEEAIDATVDTNNHLLTVALFSH